MRSLIVDDDALVRETLAALFEDHDIEVFAAMSAEEGVGILNQERVEVAIVNMRLPGADGNEFILLAHKIDPRMRFLILTGLGGYTLPPALTALGLRPRHVFRKPLSDMDELLRAAKELGACAGS